MILFLSLIAPTVYAAVPYGLCTDAKLGDLSQLGGVYAGQQDDGPVQYDYAELCSMGGPLAPTVVIETPEPKTYYNSWGKVNVRAMVTDPEGGAGHCQWFFRTGASPTR